MKGQIKYLPGLTKMICMKLSSYHRKKFSRLIRSGKINTALENKLIDFDIISFSGSRDLEEQFISIYSFVFYAGVPLRWIIYSDGTYSENDKEIFLRAYHFVEFKEWNYNRSLSENPLLKSYLKEFTLAKKLHVIAGHDYIKQTMYVDSDILFYKNASAYFSSVILKEGFWYMADTNWRKMTYEDFVKRIEMYALNSGLLILNKDFNFKFIYEYLEGLNYKFEYFSEQSSFDYAFKKQMASLLDPRQFIVSLVDQFKYSIEFGNDEMAVRHYVTPVRHKIWQKGWKWHFNS